MGSQVNLIKAGKYKELVTCGLLQLFINKIMAPAPFEEPTTFISGLEMIRPLRLIYIGVLGRSIDDY